LVIISSDSSYPFKEETELFGGRAWIAHARMEYEKDRSAGET
jgi:hypothetical protein